MPGSIVKRVHDVQPHPDSKRSHLNVVILSDGAQLVSMKLDGGIPRYSKDDMVVHIQGGSILPTDLLKRLDVWDEATGRGKLKGSLGNRMKASKFGDVMSDGMLLPAGEIQIGSLVEGDDVSSVLGVTFVNP